MEQTHATCVDIDGAGVLLRGPSGSGKSDLALRLIDAGARLVADDRADLALEGKRIVATAPAALKGMIEVRGVGVLALDPLPKTAIGLVVDLVTPDKVERVPGPATTELLGVALPLYRLSAFEASAPAKVRAALKAAYGARARDRR